MVLWAERALMSGYAQRKSPFIKPALGTGFSVGERRASDFG